MGIPGDVFIAERLDRLSMQDKRALAKEYIKFNERCFMRLLGDMRSYNYVVVITQDFDRVQYRLRSIDFDQQSYEGKSEVYQPQQLPENDPLTKMTREVLPEVSVQQYIQDERSLLAKRATSEAQRLEDLLGCMKDQSLSIEGKIEELKRDLLALTGDVQFKRADNMGAILEAALNFVRRNYKNDSPFAR